MYLTLFADDKEYLDAQKKTSRRRSGNPCHIENEFVRAAEWWRERHADDPHRIMCHGARSGGETDHWRSLFGDSLVSGTDLHPPEGSGVQIHDFRLVVPQWINAFDIVYSNSLDHADDPQACLEVWVDQLRAGKYLMIQWTKCHRTIEGGDCFGAELHEYVMLVERLCVVKEVLYCGKGVYLIVAAKK